MTIKQLSGPVRLTDRAPGPDVARGAVLALIALAHAPAYLSGRPLAIGGYPADGSGADQAVVFAETATVVGRGYPMFAALLGYGLVQLWSRRTDAPGQTRRLIRRRGLWLIVFGFVHAALLWGGDILGAYGVLALLLGAGLITARARWTRALAITSILIVASGGASMALAATAGGTSPLPSTGESNALAAVALRLTEWLPSLILQPLGMLAAVLAGAWAARRRLLDDPERQVRVLRRIAIIGLPVAVLGGLPWAAAVAGYWTNLSEGQIAAAGALHAVSGYGGVGYAALITLAVIGKGDNRLAVALRACGRRSLTSYLLQSVLLVVLLAPYALGLGERVGAATVALLGIAAWLTTVVVAVLLERAGRRGPAESLLRRLTYRRVTSAGGAEQPSGSGA